ncbi:MAG TPA: HDIG domain-containing protein [Methanoregulaceae archaeon]|nr:HDIG domain-containing protein [Methanoregulaceae archaeon]
MDREESFQLLCRYVKSEGLISHCLATSAIMKHVAGYLGQDEGYWETIGLLHDIDYEMVNEDMSRHGIEGCNLLLKNGYDVRIAETVKRHNDMIFGKSTTPADVTLQAADNISGLIIACALVKGGHLLQVTKKTVKKKFKDKSFAAGCRREKVREIEQLMDLDTFFSLAVEAMIEIRKDLGLE